MRHFLQALGHGDASGGIGQIKRHMLHAFRQRRRSARQRQHLPVWQRCEVLDRSRADHATGTGDQDGVFFAGHRDFFRAGSSRSQQVCAAQMPAQSLGNLDLEGEYGR